MTASEMTEENTAESFGNYRSDDPFAPNPKALKFSDVGDSYTGKVLSRPEMIQQLDFKTRKPQFWDSGEPRMVAVLTLEIDGIPRSLWAAKPSAMFAALRAASEAVGESVDIGGTLTVTFYDTKPATKRGEDDQKLFEAEYIPPRSR